MVKYFATKNMKKTNKKQVSGQQKIAVTKDKGLKDFEKHIKTFTTGLSSLTKSFEAVAKKSISWEGA